MPGAETFLQPFDQHMHDVEYVQRLATNPGAPVSYEFLRAAEILMRENHLQMPLTVREALDFYLELKHLFYVELQH